MKVKIEIINYNLTYKNLEINEPQDIGVKVIELITSSISLLMTEYDEEKKNRVKNKYKYSTNSLIHYQFLILI